MEYITRHEEFALWDDQPWQGYTKFPIAVTYLGHYVDSYQTIQEAKAEIDEMPQWLEVLKAEYEQRYGNKPTGS